MSSPKIRTRRIYEPPQRGEGRRILVDRVWPRGISKQSAKLDYWAKDCAPSTELRKWYRHDPERWEEFRRRYFAELDNRPEAIEALKPWLSGTVTLLFSSKETELNNATAFRQYLEKLYA